MQLAASRRVLLSTVLPAVQSPREERETANVEEEDVPASGASRTSRKRSHARSEPVKSHARSEPAKSCGRHNHAPACQCHLAHLLKRPAAAPPAYSKASEQGADRDRVGGPVVMELDTFDGEHTVPLMC